MPKSYNIVLNSFFCTSDTLGNLTSDKNYYIDWSSIMPKGEYELTFSFIAEGNYITTQATLPLIYIDFLTASKVNATQTGFQASSSTFLGNVYSTYLDPNAHICYYRADQAFNNPIFLSNRPYDNLFNVKIVTNDNPPVPWVDQATIPVTMGPYVLNLHFKLLKEAV